MIISNCRCKWFINTVEMIWDENSISDFCWKNGLLSIEGRVNKKCSAKCGFRKMWVLLFGLCISWSGGYYWGGDCVKGTGEG